MDQLILLYKLNKKLESEMIMDHIVLPTKILCKILASVSTSQTMMTPQTSYIYIYIDASSFTLNVLALRFMCKNTPSVLRCLTICNNFVPTI